MAYETVIGLEVHVQLATQSKAFCRDSAAFGGAPNTHTGVISLAHPGTLPRLNKTAVQYAVRLGLSLDCRINRRSTFDRKNYFYADLPKGFQTTQDANPICIGGSLQVKRGDALAPIRLHHIHLEEDAGKSLHDQDPHDSLIDLNRAGVPLLEIVTEPDFRSAEEVSQFMESMRRLVRWIGVSDGNMEEGSLRCDVNISIRPEGSETFGTRCEIKNMNSMRFARRAIAYEVERQVKVLESGGRIEQETRGFDPQSGETYSLREKENAHDYRYFPEPDLPPVLLSEDYIAQVAHALPELPEAAQARMQSMYELNVQDAQTLCNERSAAEYFFLLAENAQKAGVSGKLCANFIINQLLPWSAGKHLQLSESPVRVENWTAMLTLIEKGAISASACYQRLLPALLDNPETPPQTLAEQLNLLQDQDSDALSSAVAAVLAKYPEKVAEYKKGKKGLIGFFMGEVMKASKGKANPQEATKMIEAHITPTPNP